MCSYRPFCAMRVQGSSLLELSLVMLLSSTFVLLWLPAFSRPLVELDQRLSEGRQRQHFYQLGGWLEGELRRAIESGLVNWQWLAEENCLLFGDELGLRLRSGHLQWRGGDRLCSDGYWSSLNESAHAYIETFQFSMDTSGTVPQAFIFMTGRVGNDLLEWRIRFDGQLALSD